MSPGPIDALCLDPRETRALARAGQLTPCYRCLAYLPNSRSGCHFIEVGSDSLTRPPPEPADQTELFPTRGTIVENRSTEQ